MSVSVLKLKSIYLSKLQVFILNTHFFSLYYYWTEEIKDLIIKFDQEDL